MLSQTQATLNTPISSSLTLSSPHQTLSYSHSTNQTKIHEYIASFIYPSSFQLNQPNPLASDMCKQQQFKSRENGISVETLSKPSSNTVERLIACYETLLKDITEEHRKNREYMKKFCLLAEVLYLVKINQFWQRLTEFLDWLAILAIEHPQDSLYRLFYVSWSIVTNSSTQFPLRNHLSIPKLLNTMLNSSMAREAELSLCYSKYCLITSKVLEDKDHILNRIMSKLLNRQCLLFDIIGFKSSAYTCHGASKLEAEGCKGSYFEDELENHEEYSTTSGSSRTTNDCNMKSVGGTTITVPNEISPNMLYELYDGCFFGNLIIPFGPEDKLVIPEEEFQGTTTYAAFESSSPSYWEKDYYRYPKSHAYESPRRSNNYISYQPKHVEGGNRKVGYYISYEPKQKEQQELPRESAITAPTVSYTIISKDNTNNTIPSTVSMTDFPDVTSSNTGEPIRLPNKAKTAVGQTSRLTLEIPKPAKYEERAHSGTSIRDKSWESLSSFPNEKQSKIPNSSLLPSRTNTSPKGKNNDKVHYGKGETTTTKKKAPTTKKEEKGEFKLWDLINVKGKLKTG